MGFDGLRGSLEWRSDWCTNMHMNMPSIQLPSISAKRKVRLMEDKGLRYKQRYQVILQMFPKCKESIAALMPSGLPANQKGKIIPTRERECGDREKC